MLHGRVTFHGLASQLAAMEGQGGRNAMVVTRCGRGRNAWSPWQRVVCTCLTRYVLVTLRVITTSNRMASFTPPDSN